MLEWGWDRQIGRRQELGLASMAGERGSQAGRSTLDPCSMALGPCSFLSSPVHCPTSPLLAHSHFEVRRRRLAPLEHPFESMYNFFHVFCTTARDNERTLQVRTELSWMLGGLRFPNTTATSFRRCPTVWYCAADVAQEKKKIA